MCLKVAKRRCLTMCAGDEASLDRRRSDASIDQHLSIFVDGPFVPLFDQNGDCTIFVACFKTC